jgi:hypothetical protein
MADLCTALKLQRCAALYHVRALEIAVNFWIERSCIKDFEGRQAHYCGRL